MAAGKRRSVQEQNQETREELYETATAFRRDPKGYPWLVETLMAHSQLSEKGGILIRLKRLNDQLGVIYEGLWLSGSRQFFSFSVLVPYDRRERMIIEDWRDVTTEIEIRERKPGTGKTLGLLAFEVQAELLESHENRKHS